MISFLGIDPSGYRPAHQNSNDDYENGSLPVTDEERFQSCDKYEKIYLTFILK